MRRTLWVTALLVAVTASTGVEPAVGAGGSWESAGSTHVAHGATHSGSALHGGGVLVTGGGTTDDVSTAATDVYDPQSNAWLTVADMSVPRSSHSATALHNGKVVVAGGYDQQTCPPNCDVAIHASAEMFDSKTSSWSPVAAMSGPRTHHQYGTVLIHGGGVLVTGGLSDTAVLATAEIYRPGTDSWVPAASMNVARYRHIATRLHGGKVLVAGGAGSDGSPLASAEVYDPKSDTWTLTAPMSIPRADFTMTPLHTGEVLVAGGIATAPQPGFVPTATAETYDPKTGTWTSAGTMTSPRFGHVAANLHQGQVLVAGGEDMDVHPVASAEIFDVKTRTWTTTQPLSSARAFPVAVPLTEGRALVVGGFIIGQGLTSAELYSV